jgi:DNA-binding IclR family transcriptional regulator
MVGVVQMAEADRPLLDVLGKSRQGESEADGGDGEVERAAAWAHFRGLLRGEEANVHQSGKTFQYGKHLAFSLASPSMSSLLERGFKILELLAAHPEAGRCRRSPPRPGCRSAPPTPAERAERCGYVRQARNQGDYVLTIKLVSLGLGFLSASGWSTSPSPSLDRLGRGVARAGAAGDRRRQRARLRRQGAGRDPGLRYDPDMGLSVPLSCSAAGHAWLSTDERRGGAGRGGAAGLRQPDELGPKAPTTVKALLGYVRAARKRGYSVISEVFAPAMSAMSAPVISRGVALGVVTIAGPLVRLTEERMAALGEPLMATAAEIAGLSAASSLFRRSA